MENLYKNDMGIVNLTFDDFKLNHNSAMKCSKSATKCSKSKKVNKKVKVEKVNDIKIINKKFNNGGLIIFYTPWCGHCRKFVSAWNELAHLFLNKYQLGAFNCEDTFNNNDKICRELNIKQYPTIMYMDKNKSLKKYNGTRNKEELIFFISQNK